MVTITEIAERAGVAKSTVSNALTGKKYVSEELKKKYSISARS
jgi:DNA-binding LacI/PurR family transcriptional regulator